MSTTLTIETPQPVVTPSAISVMGAGEEIKDINELSRFHTPNPTDGGNRDYHSHSFLFLLQHGDMMYDTLIVSFIL